MMGEALSRSKAWRNIGLVRYRAAKVQTQWSQHLAWLRKQHKKSKAEKGRTEVSKDRGGKGKGKDCGGQAEYEKLVEAGDDEGYEYTDDESSDESEEDITMADVRGEMDPFIDEEMD